MNYHKYLYRFIFWASVFLIVGNFFLSVIPIYLMSLYIFMAITSHFILEFYKDDNYIGEFTIFSKDEMLIYKGETVRGLFYEVKPNKDSYILEYIDSKNVSTSYSTHKPIEFEIINIYDNPEYFL